jgi:purine-binding chemotaxis protein CheW
MVKEEHNEEGLLVSVFRLGDAMFAIPAAQIQEVVQMGSVTPVHHAPAYIVGIRNLRGRIVTVIDLGVRLELGQAERSADSRILIVDLESELVGLLVDGVDDTIFVQPETMSPPPPNLGALQSEVLRGVYHCPNGLVTLLDHSTILKPTERDSAALTGRR